MRSLLSTILHLVSWGSGCDVRGPQRVMFFDLRRLQGGEEIRRRVEESSLEPQLKLSWFAFDENSLGLVVQSNIIREPMVCVSVSGDLTGKLRTPKSHNGISENLSELQGAAWSISVSLLKKDYFQNEHLTVTSLQVCWSHTESQKIHASVTWS